jgi:hypothetical protein
MVDCSREGGFKRGLKKGGKEEGKLNIEGKTSVHYVLERRRRRTKEGGVVGTLTRKLVEKAL